MPLADASAAAIAPPSGERVLENAAWPTAQPRLSVIVPTYRDDAANLIRQLSAATSAEQTEIILFDDGTNDTGLLARVWDAASASSGPVRIVVAERNVGRAAARNRGIAHARSDWFLLLDADMLPDDPGFLAAYLHAIGEMSGPGVIVGGCSTRQAPQNRHSALHRWQSEASECAPATVRSRAPGRYLFAGNVLAHRAVLAAAPFDESFAGWGWEDTEWGLRVEGRFPIVHIQNTASHLGLCDDDALMRKYAQSGPNFARMVERHRGAVDGMPLFRAARAARALPAFVRAPIRATAGWLARDPASVTPLALRGFCLKLWRAFVYADSL